MYWGLGSNPAISPLLHVFPHSMSPVSIKKRKRKLWPNYGCWDFCRLSDGETYRAADHSFPQLFLGLLTSISRIICQTRQCGVNYLRSDVQLWREHLPSSPLNQSINVAHLASENIRGSISCKVICFQRLPRLHSSYTHLIWVMNTEHSTSHKAQTKWIHMFYCVWIWWVHFSVTTQVDQLLCLWEIFSDWLTIDEAQRWVLYR